MKFLFPILLLGCGPGPDPAPPPLVAHPVQVDPSVMPTLVAEAELAAVGDIMMHGMVKRTAGRLNELDETGVSTNFDGYGALFASMASALAEPDFVFGNLETPIAPESHQGTDVMVFNAPVVLLDALADVGFDMVSFANNHVYDQGIPGFVETIEHLNQSPLDMIGAGEDCEQAFSGKIVELNGIKVAMIGGSQLYNGYFEPAPGKGCSFYIREAEQVISVAAAAREAGAEIVVTSIHWGAEYKVVPAQATVDLAHKLLDGGVDVILGHHPHVLQPIEVYEAADGRMTLVAYSLGNFISAQGLQYRYGIHSPHVGNTRDGAILRFKVVRKDYGDAGQRVELAAVRADPIWMTRRARGSTDLPYYGPVVNRIEINRLTEAILAEEDSARRVVLQKELEMLSFRRTHAGAILGEDWLMPL